MDLISYLNIARRRWMLIVAAVAVTLTVVWLTLPARAETSSSFVTYRATATLVATPSNDIQLNLPTVALFATLGVVPQLAATRLDYPGDPQALAATVTTSVSTETNTLTLSSTGDRANAVARKVNVFAEELISYFERSDREEAQSQLRALDRTLNAYVTRIKDLDRKIALNPGADSALMARRGGLQAHYEGLVSAAATLEDQLVSTAPIELLQPGVAVPETSSGFAPPTSPTNRLLVGGLLGLGLGFALALIVERLDSRLRTREQAEDALRLPVLAEIPTLAWHRRKDHTVLSAVEPGSATAEAYRSLRSAVLLLKPKPAHGHPTQEATLTSSSVILVTSPRPADGKSSTVANLAVVMAESGRSVLVLSLDFRNPSIHDYLDTPDGTGLSDLLIADRPEDLENVVRDTPFTGVRIATSGQETSHPGALLAGAGRLISEARYLADVVLIDTAPLLAMSDAVDLSPHVDAALVVTRANRTTTAQARAAHRLLSRLGVPALGAVLIGGSGGGTYDGYTSPSSLPQQLAVRFGVPSRQNRSGASSDTAGVFRTTPPKDTMSDD